ncbi:MAG: formate/nitrite transporter family protein [Planctomycetes bacterium]|nr:formate/nitrite transporter family protein [Planctomycetota bacterium]
MAENNFLTPPELAKAFVGVGVKKASLPIGKMILLGILAGVYIGFAAHLATTVATGWTIGGTAALFGLKKFFIGAVFSVGLMLVIIPGSELFTGNNLLTVALCHGKLGFGGVLRNWIPVYVANLIGSVILAWIIAASSGLLSGGVGGTAINIALGKVAAVEGHNYTFFFRAICCNFLVCIAVMMAISAKDIAGKVLAIFFPIMAFVTSGFEHCVANMYFIPAGIFAKNFSGAVEASGKSAEQLATLNWSTMWTNNLISVTLGNIVGGAVFVGVIYYFLYVRGTDTEAK